MPPARAARRTLIALVAIVVARAQPAHAQPTAAILTTNEIVLLHDDAPPTRIPAPEGARAIAFDWTNEGLFVAGPSALVHIDADTGAVDRLLTDDWERIDAPALSPDGRTIAFSGYTRAGRWGVYTLTGRNANPVRVATGFAPAFLPDGRTLLFENYTDESAQIFRLDPDTRSVSRIDYDAPDVQHAVSVAASPGGRFLSFSAHGSLYIEDEADDSARRLTQGESYDARQSFTPDARTLLFIRWTRSPDLGRIDPRAMRIDIESGETELLLDEPAIDVAAPFAPPPAAVGP